MAPIVSFHVELRDPKPPSVNAMYSSGATRRFLTREGVAFKDALRIATVRATQELHIPWKNAVDEVYLRKGWVELVIGVYLSAMYNKSWTPGGRTKPTASAPNGNLRSPYQKVDAGSYDKIIQDAIVLGTGIDDSAHLYYSVFKAEDPDNPRITVDYTIHKGARDGD